MSIPKFEIAVLLDDQARLELHITSDLLITNAHIEAAEHPVQFIDITVVDNRYSTIFVMPRDAVFMASIGTMHMILFSVNNTVRCMFCAVTGDFAVLVECGKNKRAIDAFLSGTAKGIEHGFAVLEAGHVAEVQIGGC